MVFACGIAPAFSAVQYAIASHPYEGIFNYFAPCAQAPCRAYTIDMSVSGTFTTDDVLEPNLPLQTIAARTTSFRFSDGVNVYAHDDPDVRVGGILVATDSQGRIVEHLIWMEKWVSGTAPHQPYDRFSRMRTIDRPSETSVSVLHNYDCFATWTLSSGVGDACKSSGRNNSSSSADYQPGVSWSAEKRPVVEYFHAAFGHYFMSADPDEITGLDYGAYDGAFVRTGLGFTAYDVPVAGSVPVCRFFTTPGNFGSRSSHFYTSNPVECEGLKANPNWIYEKIAFHIFPLTEAWCMGQTVPVYRMYNHGQTGAPNHRFTTDKAIYDAFTSTGGWDPEGIAFCSPQPD